jgi:hypothetical protein
VQVVERPEEQSGIEGEVLEAQSAGIADLSCEGAMPFGLDDLSLDRVDESDVVPCISKRPQPGLRVLRRQTQQQETTRAAAPGALVLRATQFH